jgi:hypothetical protein
MSELSGAESEARQSQRPNETDTDTDDDDGRRHHPGPAVTGDKVGFAEQAAADADRARMEQTLTRPSASAQ